MIRGVGMAPFWLPLSQAVRYAARSAAFIPPQAVPFIAPPACGAGSLQNVIPASIAYKIIGNAHLSKR